ncbi:Uncharacterised protein [Enterococcus hirae]|nr:Uncharacterised protein [Enterococcus hirae]
MKIVKHIIFWSIVTFFSVSNFIRLFINDNYEKTIRIYFRDIPLYLKIFIILVFIFILWWSFPYKKYFKLK